MEEATDIRYHGPVAVFDLDDTLFKERDFAFSGYAAIETHTRIPRIASLMKERFLRGENPMDAALEARDGIPYELEDFLQIYRYHKPNLTLGKDTDTTLSTLSKAGVRMYIVTDGRSKTQRNKTEALGLGRYFPPERIYISEETGYDKRSGESFRRIVRSLPEASCFYYIGDNPAKDFEAANMLGWTTVMLKDTAGENIHPQRGDFPPVALPTITIDNIEALITIILKK